MSSCRFRASEHPTEEGADLLEVKFGRKHLRRPDLADALRAGILEGYAPLNPRGEQLTDGGVTFIIDRCYESDVHRVAVGKCYQAAHRIRSAVDKVGLSA